MDLLAIKSFGELRAAGYKPKTLKQELRENLIYALRNDLDPFDGIQGYEKTVRPQVERAILAGHNILLLGLRGQAKTKFARLMVNLLDEFIPAISSTVLHEDPFHPITNYGRIQMKTLGDDCLIDWIPRDARLVEKLATPDVSVADLIGDIDPIKAMNQKLTYADEEVIHFGLVPRTNRGIFIINELPDLQPRIQVSLLNILQERDIQIRGFNLRIPLDVLFVFTANPEDYTNRGNIITPLKDRIESQIITHYPQSIIIGKSITQQEIKIGDEIKNKIHVPEIARDLVEIVSIVARKSEYIDQSSGVSARLGIAAMEHLYASAHRRLIVDDEKTTSLRVSDFINILPAMTGKLELVYEGEQKGAVVVSQYIIETAIESLATKLFRDPKTIKDEEIDPYGTMRAYFGDGNAVILEADFNDESYGEALSSVPGLKKVTASMVQVDEEDLYFYQELALHALSGFEVIQREMSDRKMHFDDPLSNMF